MITEDQMVLAEKDLREGISIAEKILERAAKNIDPSAITPDWMRDTQNAILRMKWVLSIVVTERARAEAEDEFRRAL